MKGVVFRIVSLLVGVLVALVLAEIFLAALGGAGGTDLRALHEPRPDRPWIYGLRPGAVVDLAEPRPLRYEINADGFRDHLHPLTKPEGVFRILVLGDSIAFGYGVTLEESFTKQLEANLSGEVPVEVLNLGVNGYNPYNEAALLADRGIRYRPDLVLVQFCVNDLNDPTLHFDAQTRLHLGLVPDAAYPDPGSRSSPSGLALWAASLCRRLRSCALADDAWIAWRDRQLAPDAMRRGVTPLAALDPGPVRDWLAARYAGMAETAAAAGAGFAVIVFPHRAQVERGASQELQRGLASLGREEGWYTIDLLPDFIDARQPDVPLFVDIWHPTAAGHRVAAESVARSLVENGLIPAAVPAGRGVGPDQPME